VLARASSVIYRIGQGVRRGVQVDDDLWRMTDTRHKREKRARVCVTEIYIERDRVRRELFRFIDEIVFHLSPRY